MKLRKSLELSDELLAFNGCRRPISHEDRQQRRKEIKGLLTAAIFLCIFSFVSDLLRAKPNVEILFIENLAFSVIAWAIVSAIWLIPRTNKLYVQEPRILVIRGSLHSQYRWKHIKSIGFVNGKLRIKHKKELFNIPSSLFDSDYEMIDFKELVENHLRRIQCSST